MPQNAYRRNALTFQPYQTKFPEKINGYRAFEVTLSRIVRNDSGGIKYSVPFLRTLQLLSPLHKSTTSTKVHLSCCSALHIILVYLIYLENTQLLCVIYDGSDILETQNTTVSQVNCSLKITQRCKLIANCAITNKTLDSVCSVIIKIVYVIIIYNSSNSKLMEEEQIHRIRA